VGDGAHRDWVGCEGEGELWEQWRRFGHAKAADMSHFRVGYLDRGICLLVRSRDMVAHLMEDH
jgi:hypothetical protein